MLTPPSTPALHLALAEGRVDPAMREAAAALGGEPPTRVAHSLLAWALERCGREAAGASWSHALLTVSAAAALGERLAPERVAPAVVGAAGFLAFARPSRARREVQPRPWSGVDAWLDALRAGDLPGALAGPPGEADRARASLLSAAGWGHHGILAGHLGRCALRWPDLADAAWEATVRAWVPMEREELPPGPGRSLQEAAVAALELLRRAPDLRAVHGVTYAREVLELWGAVDDRAVARLDAFVEQGWERARRERRLRGEAAVFSVPAVEPTDDADRDALLDDLLRTEPRPGFGHNLKIAEASLRLAELLPAERPRIDAALAATRPAWTRSRRPWLIWRDL